MKYLISFIAVIIIGILFLTINIVVNAHVNVSGYIPEAYLLGDISLEINSGYLTDGDLIY